MEKKTLKTEIAIAQPAELSETDQQLIDMAIEATDYSYAPYSHFHVGASILLKNGKMIKGCNQENAAFPSGICAERSAIFAAGAQYPDQPIMTIAIAARNTKRELTEEPVSPCGTCRQVIIETETRFKQPVRIILYGKKYSYIIDSIKQLMPLSFTEF